MTESNQNNKRIAKNTFFLYIRMFITMAVGLYTSRIILKELGSVDFGIYNLIAGVIVLFSFINNAMTTATQRNLNYYVGKNDLKNTQKVFCMSMNTYAILALLFIFIAETLGLWFVNNKLNIPINRMDAARFVYHVSVFNFTVCLLRIPYNATIIAYEKMNFFAYASLAESIFKLLIVYLLSIVETNLLELYALLHCLVTIIVNIIYRTYSRKKFSTAHYTFLWDFDFLKKLLSFFGWSLLGSSGNVIAQHGINILINIFFGVIANAAVGIANQVSSQVYSFVSNFQTAFQPRIVMYYAKNEVENMHALVFQASKFSFYLIMLIAFPFILTFQTILSVWLVDIPENAAIFGQLIIGFYIIDALAAPLWMEIYATGNIKNYQVISFILVLLNFPLTYLCFCSGMPVFSAWVNRVIVNIIIFIVRCIYMKKAFSFPLRDYIKQVLFPICMVIICSIPIPFLMKIFFPQTLLFDILIFFTTFLISATSIIFIGINKNERDIIFALPNTIKKRFWRK